MKKILLLASIFFALVNCPAKSQDYSKYNQLNTPEVNFSKNRWKPEAKQFQTPDMSSFQNALSKREQRMYRALDCYRQFSEYAQKLRDKIDYKDKVSLGLFDKLYEKYNDEISQEIEWGNYSKAAEKAIKYKIELMNNEELYESIRKWNDR